VRESKVERYLRLRVKSLGGECVKVKWINRKGAPDRRIWGKCWVEVKAPGESLAPHQVREHRRMVAQGERVEVVDSCEAVELLMRDLWRV
jgi:hypothetical protein